MQGCQDGIRANRGFDFKSNNVDFGVILCLGRGIFQGYSFKKSGETNPVNWLMRAGEGVEAARYFFLYLVQMFHVEQGIRGGELRQGAKCHSGVRGKGRPYGLA